jgi:mannose-6-phosphate isomerase-like protein (cupin superfamily)
MSDRPAPPGKLMVDPYLDWTRKEGVPVYEDFGFDLLSLETAPWARMNVNGAIAHTKGRGDFMSIFLLDIPPGGSTAPQHHLFEAAFFVLSGHGNTRVEDSFGNAHSFEWGPNSVFAPTLNTPYQIFNGSGREPARIAIAHNLPAVLNLFHSEAFVFTDSWRFQEREGNAKHYTGDGDFIHVRAGKHMWETNFVPDVSDIKLHAWDARGGGGGNIKLILGDGILHVHVSDMPIGTYKKAHRHKPDVHVLCVNGEGYSLFWYEGDKDFVRLDWRRGWVYAPPDMMFHQHFNAGREPARYLAVGHGSIRYPFTQNVWDIIKGVDIDIRSGGNQIEYEDQDPRIQRIFLQELARNGVGECDPHLAKAPR